MKIALSVLYVFIFFYQVSSQNEESNWVFGRNCGLNFGLEPPENFISNTLSYEVSTSISDSSGNLLAYLSLPNQFYDSAAVRNANNEVIFNGGGINTWSTYAGGAIFLRNPDNYNQFYLVYVASENSNDLNVSLYFALLDMSLENGNGALIEKNVLLFYGHFGEGISVTKHANGIDWWLVVHEIHKLADDSNCTNTFVKFLLTEDGFQGPFLQNIGTPDCHSEWYPNGWLKFSEKGNRLAFGLTTTYIDYSTSPPNFKRDKILDIFRFNRCTGDIYDYKSLIPNVSSVIYPYGLEFSKNENILYVTSGFTANISTKLFQIDLTQPNNSNSVTQVWADYSAENGAGQLKLAPNGNIYMAYSSRSSGQFLPRDSVFTHISYINSPDSIGALCDFKPFFFYLGDSCICRMDLPNIPNYKLGAIAWEDCLVIVNESEFDHLKVYPNPTRNYLTIEGNKFQAQFKVFNLLGEEVLNKLLFVGKTNIELSGLSKGLYLYTINEENRFGKLVIE
jgi:hypothetical protein